MNRLTMGYSVMAGLLMSLSVSADYAEECKSEGCNTEELRELYGNYKSECIDERCSQEEINEIAGNAASANEMLEAFRARGWVVRTRAFESCDPVGAQLKCYGVVSVCRDWYFCPAGGDGDSCDGEFACPGGNTVNSYACGACLGFDF